MSHLLGQSKIIAMFVSGTSTYAFVRRLIGVHTSYRPIRADIEDEMKIYLREKCFAWYEKFAGKGLGGYFFGFMIELPVRFKHKLVFLV